MRRTTILAFSLILAACASTPSQPPPQPPTPTPQQLRMQAFSAGGSQAAPSPAERMLGTFAAFFEGTYQTVPQEAGHGDSSAVTLRIAKIFPGRSGEEWRYLEYAKAGEEAKPFRQRIYRFAMSGDAIIGTEFELPGAAGGYVGEWRKTQPFEGVRPESLRERAHCALDIIRQLEMVFAGGTVGTACPPENAGSHHNHWDFYLTSSSIRSWERGLDPAGRPVTGPTGPWEFRKLAQNVR